MAKRAGRAESPEGTAAAQENPKSEIANLKSTIELRIENLPVGLIVLNGDNVRKIDEKDPEFIELADSVRAAGVCVPVMVRPHPEMSGKYQLRAGHRRVRAAIAAGCLTVPGIIYDGLEDGEAEFMSLIENKFRKDPSIFEQTAQVEKLLIAYKGETKAVAAKMGIPEYRVRQLAAVNQKISPALKNDILKNGLPAGWTLAHLAFLANQPANVQEELLTHSADLTNCRMLAEMEKYISSRQMLIKSATWDTSDKGLVKKAGACDDCAKRTDRIPGLFGEDADPEKAVKDARCMDPGCWARKKAAVLNRKFLEEKKDRPDMAAAFAKKQESVGRTEDKTLRKVFGKILHTYSYQVAKKGEKGARPVFIVNGPDAGKIINAVINAGAETGPVKKEKPEEKTIEQKRDELNADRWLKVINAAIELLSKAKFADINTPSPAGTVLAIALCFGVNTWDLEIEDRAKFIEKCGSDEKAAREAGEKLWEAARQNIDLGTNDEDIEILKALGAIFNIDIDKLFAAAVKELPEPEEWHSADYTAKPGGISASETKPRPRGTKPRPRGTKPRPRGTKPRPRGTKPRPRGTKPRPRGTKPAKKKIEKKKSAKSL